jgi:hypothetical protein
MVDERLSQFLKQGNDWERKVTSIPGVFLLKLPTFKSRPESIVIEVNPVDTSGSELEQIRNILTNVKLEQLSKSIDEVNPEVKTATAKDSSDIFQI